MGRVLSLTSEYANDTCSCMALFMIREDEIGFAILQIKAENFDILTEPVTAKPKNWRMVSNDNFPVINRIEKALGQYLKKNKDRLAPE